MSRNRTNNVLPLINARAREIKNNQGIPWRQAVKQAGAEYRSGKLGGALGPPMVGNGLFDSKKQIKRNLNNLKNVFNEFRSNF